ncbi:MAG: hypothetical protein IJL20_12925 [Lachnospiraceae bacterium]|nr:hypothetical protein [Lachnospiraceae bacterium]
MVQSNTSIYGDSRISGPYSRDYRNIVQIKGGDEDNLIIGTINILEVIKYREKERRDMDNDIKSILSMSHKNKMKKKNQIIEEMKKNKISKTSARTSL